MNNKVYFGKWYFPRENKDEIITFDGILTIKLQQEITLEFTTENSNYDNFIPSLDAMLSNMNNQIAISYISGIAKDKDTNKDTYFTLIDLEIIEYTSQTLSTFVLQAKRAITSYNIKSLPNLKFESSMMKYDGLDEWADVYGFNINHTEKDSKRFNTTIEYEQPEPIWIEQSDDINFYIYFRVTGPNWVDSHEKVIKQSVFLNVSFNNPKTLDELISLTNKLQDFFSFITYQPCKRITHESRIKSKDTINHELFYVDRVKHINPIHKKDLMFTYSAYKDRSTSFLSKWLELYEKYEISLTQYFDLKYSIDIHLTSRFITLLSVLEIFYYKCFNDDVASLKLKLDGLLNQCPNIINLFSHVNGNWAQQVVSIRKYFVHGKQDTNFKIENISEDNLLKYSIQLESLFRIHILIELGLSEEEIITMINRHPWKWGVRF